MRLLLRKDPSVADSAGYAGRTLLSFAAEYGNEAVVKLLVNDHHSRPDSIDENGRTPLMYAARWGQTNVMGFLLQQEASLASRADHYGATPLAHAARYGYFAAKLLLDCPDVTADTAEGGGMTPLARAVCSGRGEGTECVRVLVNRSDVQLNVRNNMGRTPLYLAVQERSVERLAILLTRSDMLLLDAKCGGKTPLMCAARWDHLVAVSLLLKHGAQADCQDDHGRTAFSYAAESASLETVKLLGTRPDVQVDRADDSGRTPLSYAAGRSEWRRRTGEDSKVVKFLLSCEGVSPATPDNSGRTPLSYAQQDGREEIQRLLQHAMSRE
jgi:ankyrin repeat protein